MEKVKIFVVGSGKLANAILSAGLSFEAGEIFKWEAKHRSLEEKAIIVHAGSGSQLKECIEFCERTDSIFIELSTGLETGKLDPYFTLIICPNTSILVLKMMNLIRLHGNYFEDNEISILESHQSSKTSEPGTAFDFARSLKLPVEKIRSIRQSENQVNMGIPKEYLEKHAYHKILIKDGLDEVTIETKVLGHNSYSRGVEKIIQAVLHHSFEKRRYSIFELIDQNLL